MNLHDLTAEFFYDIYVEGIFYIAMEYVPGEDLKSFMRRSRQLAVGTTLAIAKQVCEGLTEAHNLEVIHRDLKLQCHAAE